MEINHKKVDSFVIPRNYDVEGKCLFKSGAYSYVFFDGGIATKVFRIDNSIPEEVVRKVFKDQVKAYMQVQSCAEVMAITPRFFGTIEFKEVINNALPYEESLAPRAEVLLWDCAYQIENVNGYFDDLNRYSFYEDVKRRFSNIGITYLIDSSVAILNDDPLKICVIDFGIEDPNL